MNEKFRFALLITGIFIVLTFAALQFSGTESVTPSVTQDATTVDVFSGQ